MLKEAFLELMREKGFSSITVQDIADKADMNRGTFYAHFPDKYALLESSIRDKFLKALNRELPPVAGWNAAHLRCSSDAYWNISRACTDAAIRRIR